MKFTVIFPTLFFSFLCQFIIDGANVLKQTAFSPDSARISTTNFTIFVAERRKILGECTADSYCTYSNSVCKSGHCVCNLPYPVIDSVGQRCLSVVYKENDACEISIQCFLSDLQCIDNKCQKNPSNFGRFLKNVKTETIVMYIAIAIALIAIAIAIKRRRHFRRETQEHHHPPPYSYDYLAVSPPNIQTDKLPTYEEATRQNTNQTV